MRQRFHIIVTILYLIYFGTFLLGRPVLEKIPESEQLERGPASLVPDSDVDLEIRELPVDQVEHWSNREKPESRVVFIPGLVQQIFLIQNTLDILDHPLLESDSRPDRFFKEMERAYLIKLFTATITILWSFAALLLLAALVRNQWFARPMVIMVFTPAILVMLTLLLGPRRDDLFLAGWVPITTLKILAESALLFMGFGALYLVALPLTGAEKEKNRPFLDHLQRSRLPAGRILGETWTIFYQMGIVMLSSLLIANFLLLPLYQLQLNFPALFAFLLLPGLGALAIFYVTAYVKVARFQNENANLLDGITFLGYRFMRNTTFLGSIITLIAVTAVVIIVLSLMNVDFLQTISILKRPETM